MDQTIWVPGFRAGEVNRVVREQVTAGGKGVNVAAFLAAFGVPVFATGFLGRPNAGLFEAFFDQKQIPYEFVAVDGTTRTGIKIVDEIASATTDINFGGFHVDEDDLRALEDALAEVIAPGRWVVLAGSLPAGLRRRPTGAWSRSSVSAAGTWPSTPAGRRCAKRLPPGRISSSPIARSSRSSVVGRCPIARH